MDELLEEPIGLHEDGEMTCALDRHERFLRRAHGVDVTRTQADQKRIRDMKVLICERGPRAHPVSARARFPLRLVA